MINFRFHIVSLVAVFLALAIGIVMGYGVFSQPTFEGLQARIDHVDRRSSRIRAENRELRKLDENSQASYADVAPFATKDRLTGVSVLVVATRGINENAVHRAADAAVVAGATVSGVLWLEDRWGLTSDSDLAAMRGLVGEPDGRRGDVRDTGLLLLAGRLAVGVSGNRVDVLPALVDQGFVRLEAVGTEAAPSLSRVGGFGTRVLFAAGPDERVAPNLMVPQFTRVLASSRVPLVVGEVANPGPGRPARGAVVGPIRADAQLSKVVSTDDHLDRAEGALSSVIALADLGHVPAVIGHYGYADSATARFPEWSPAR